MDHYGKQWVGGRGASSRDRLRVAACALLAVGLCASWPGVAAAGEVQVYGRVVDVSTFNDTATRPRLDDGQIVELTFAVDRVVSDDVAEPIGRRLTMFLPLREAATRADVQGLSIDAPTYVTLYLGSPVKHFRFHRQMEPPPGGGVENVDAVR